MASLDPQNPYYKDILDHMLEGCQIVSFDWRYLYVNDVVAAQARQEKSGLLGRKMMEVFPGIDDTSMFKTLAKCMQERSSAKMVNEFTYADGSKAWFQLSIQPVPEGLFVMSLDITGHKQDEERIRRLNRVYAMLSNVNQAIVRLRDLNALYERACQIAIQDGGFRRAWIGLLEEAGESVSVAASAGAAEGLSPRIPAAPQAEEGYPNPVAKVLQTGQRVVCNDLYAVDCSPAQQEENRRSGIRSLAVFPLAVAGRAMGVFGLDSAESNAFDDPELKLLDEMAMDISFAIQVAGQEAERRRMEQALRESEAHYRLLFDNNPLPMWLVDAGTLQFLEVNDAAVQHYGYTREEFLSMTGLDLRLPEDVPTLTKQVEGETQSSFMRTQEVRHRRKDGQVIYVQVIVHFFHLEGRRVGLSVINDITERRRAEQALRESEGRYRQIVENASVGIVVHVDNQIVYGNRASLELIGASDIEALRGRQVLEFVHPDDRPMIMSMIQSAFASASADLTGASATVEERLIRLDGAVITVEASALLINYYGKFGLLVMMNDVTLRKQAEEKIRESEAKFRSYIEHAPLGMFITDRLGNYLEVNQAAEDLLGYDAATLQSMNVSDILPPEDRESGMQSFARLLEEGFAEVELKVKKENGDVIWISLRAVGLGQERTMAFCKDITERKRIEQALRESEERYRQLVEVSPYTIFVQTGGKFAFVSPAGLKLFGAESPGQLLGKRVLDYIRPDYRDSVLERIRTLNEERVEAPLADETFLRLDGKPVDVEVIGAPITYDGQPGAIVIARDITQRKRDEEALRRSLAETEALYAVSSLLRTAQTADEALPVLLDQTLAVLGCSEGAIWLYQPASEDLRLAVARGQFRLLYDAPPIHPGRGIVGTVFSSGQTYLSTEWANDPLSAPPLEVEIPRDQGGVCVPIRAAGETLGALMITCPAPGRIAEDQVKLLTSLAEVAGATLHRFRLNENTIRHLKRLEALRSIDLVITSSLDLRHTLNVLLEQITSQLNVDAASVLLIQPSTAALNYAAGRGFRTPAIERIRLRLGEGYSGRVALERQTLLVPSLQEEGKDASALFKGEGFLAYFGAPLIAKGVVKGVLEVFKRTPMRPNTEWVNFFETLAGQAAIAIDNLQLFETLQQANLSLSIAYDATIEGWSHALDLRDKETEGHTLRVTDLTLDLARRMGLGEADLTYVRWGALLHDIGKMGIPDHILLKPGPLNEEEWVIMRKHPRYAFELLVPITYLGRAVDIPYCHHERWDGSGYPRGLQGEEIPLMARIFSIVDVWDAVLSDRPYRPAWTRDKARAYILEQKGKIFDPRVVDAFMEMIDSQAGGD